MSSGSRGARGATRNRKRAAGPWRVVSLWAGLTAVAVAVASPLDSLAHDLFWAHMVQHMLLIVCAAPLIALARPWRALARTAPRSLARRAARAARPLRRARSRAPVAVIALAALALHVGTVWAWHVPPAYALALESTPVHLASHATLFATAVVFWSCLVGAGLPGGIGRGAGIAIAFGAAAGTGILGALLTFATDPLYPEHAAAAVAREMTPIGDQQLGGLLMWIPGGMAYLVAVVVLLLGLLDAVERPTRTPAVRSERIAGT